MPELIPLRCPYCGCALEVDLEYTGFAHSDHRDHVGYECEDARCYAHWDKDGNPDRAPFPRLEE
jgi:hypothetical protein